MQQAHTLLVLRAGAYNLDSQVKMQIRGALPIKVFNQREAEQLCTCI